MSPNRLKHNQQYGTPKDAITLNDSRWNDALQPNPWKVLPSGLQQANATARAANFFVMQIDKRPGLCRKTPNVHIGTDVDGNPYVNE